MKDFSDFLEQESFGGQLDSTGHFTLGKEKALEKLAEMALEDPTHWVLKVVQGAVCAGCHRLGFVIARNTIQVDFHGVNLDLDIIEHGLLDPSYPAQDHYKELFIGLRTILLESEFRMRSPDGAWLAWDGTSLHRAEPSQTVEGPSYLIVSNSSGSRARRAADYQSVLKERALYAPLRLFVDGLEVTPTKELAATLPDFGIDQPTITTPLLYAHFQKDAVLESKHLTKSSSGIFRDSLRSLDYFLSTGRDEPKTPTSCHIHLVAKCRDEMENSDIRPRVLRDSTFSLLYTRLGVVCEQMTATFKVGGALQVPLDEGRTDLSGLSLQVPEKTHRQFDLDPYLDHLVKSIDAHMSLPHIYRPDLGRWSAGFAMAGGTAALFGVAFGGPLVALKLGSFFGTIGGSTQLSWGTDTKQQRRDLTKAVRSFRNDWKYSF